MMHLFYKTVAVMILLLLFFVTGGGVSHNDKWRIDRIDIVGANAVSPDAMRALVEEKLLGNYFFVYARENSFLFPRAEIERILPETFPRLKTVSVSSVDAHTAVATVSERKPYALWCGNEFNLEMQELADCWFIDEAGFIFDRAPVFSEGVYLKVYGTVVEKNAGDPLRGALPAIRFANVNTFAKLIRTELGEPARIEMKGERESEVAIRASAVYPFLAGVAIRFKDGEDPVALMDSLRASISAQFTAVAKAIAGKPENVSSKKKLLYIDMRFGNKIFFGFEE